MYKSFTDLFAECVVKYPEALALEAGGRSFTYADFSHIVSQIAASISASNTIGKAIGVFDEQNVYTYASIAAILRTGNAILPLQPDWPEIRVQSIFDAIQPAALLFSTEKTSAFVNNTAYGQSVPCLRTDDLLATKEQKYEIIGKDYDDIAYIIFTSGSTGTPKGVPVKVDNLNAFLSYFRSQYGFGRTDRFLQVYDITFDVAYFSFLLPLCVGACCCVLNEGPAPRYLRILKDILARRITVVSMVPTVLHFIRKYIKGRVANLVRYSFFSGDALYETDAEAWQKFIPNGVIHNFYGPTETTIVCTRHVWTQGQGGGTPIVPLGIPFPGMISLIVDTENMPMAAGSVGELCFSGLQVIENYINEEQKEKFFIGPAGQRFYKTGDMASCAADGTLFFHGRNDFQVKVNGYRVELGEVEHALERATGRKVIVVSQRNESGLNFLKAWLIGPMIEESRLREVLENHLPRYMVPEEFGFLESLPVTENGKVDRLKLMNNKQIK